MAHTDKMANHKEWLKFSELEICFILLSWHSYVYPNGRYIGRQDLNKCIKSICTYVAVHVNYRQKI